MVMTGNVMADRSISQERWEGAGPSMVERGRLHTHSGWEVSQDIL